MVGCWRCHYRSSWHRTQQQDSFKLLSCLFCHGPWSFVGFYLGQLMTAVDGSDAVANTTCWQVSWMLFPVISRCPADATSAGQYGQLSPTVQWPTETSTLLCTHTFILTILTHRHTERPYMTIVYAQWVACAFLSFPLSRCVKGLPVMHFIRL